MNKPENRRTQMTKRIVKEALIELLSKKPMNKVTVKEICEVADINRSTFYAYYEDQYDLFDEIEDDIIKKTPKINIYKDENTEKKLLTFFEFIEENKEVYKILFEGVNASRFRKRILDNVFGRTGMGNEWINSVDIKDPREFRMLMFAFGGISMVEKWIYGEINTNPVELARILSGFIMKR